MVHTDWIDILKDKSRKNIRIFAAALIAAVSLSGCSTGNTVASYQEVPDEEKGSDDATLITLNGTGASVDGAGAYAENGDVFILSDGTYKVSGKLDDGRIVVEAQQSSDITVVFDGVDIYCSDDAALRINQADKVKLELADGSKNTLESGSEYSEEALADGSGGAIFSHDDLTIKGKGTLDIKAAYKHGIDANDSLKIKNSALTVTAAADGLHANDEIVINNADITVFAKDDAISCDGSFEMKSGRLFLDGCYEGIEALTVEIDDGDITIYPTDDGINANGARSGGFDKRDYSEINDFPAPPDGMQPQKRPEGEDGMQPPQKPEQDNGMQPPGMGKMPDKGEQVISDDDVETWIHINGGNITIINENAQDADGLDSNGDIVITGGVIRISLPGGGTNNAIDYGSESGGTCTISGGEVIACGSSKMAERFSDSSTQSSILYTFDKTVEAGTVLGLEDDKGNTLLSWEVPCSFTSAALSCPDMRSDGVYYIVTGDDKQEVSPSS